MSRARKTIIHVDEMGIPTPITTVVPDARPKCPVKIGDRFYRKSASVLNGSSLKDYLKVIDIQPYKDHYAIKAKYENHGIGPFERIFSSNIFKSDDWEIVRN